MAHGEVATVVLGNEDAAEVAHIPPNVLAEEDYTRAVAAIIERDFFPDLPTLRMKHTFMHASDDEKEMLIMQMAKMTRPTPADTPSSRDAPRANFGSWGEVESTSTADCSALMRLKLVNDREVAVDLSKVRLDDFHSVFTSEDNASFEEILTRDREKSAAKEWWMDEAERLHNNHRQALLDSTCNEVVPATFHARNALMFNKSGIDYAQEERPRVEFKNTRFTTEQQFQLEESLSKAIACRKARIEEGKNVEVQERRACEGLKSLENPTDGRALAGRLQSPHVQGYALVSTPDLSELTPLMTYGKIAATPRALEVGSHFRMADETERERAAEKLQRGATQRVRESKHLSRSERLRVLGLTPSPGTGLTSRVTPYTPVGQLLHRAQKLARQGGRLRIQSDSRTQGRSTRGGTGCTGSPDEPSLKRARSETCARLPASITDDLLS